MKPAKQSKIQHSSKDQIDETYLDPKNQKHKVTFWMDGDIKAELQRQAAEVGAGYQTYMHKLIKDAVDNRRSFFGKAALPEDFFKANPIPNALRVYVKDEIERYFDFMKEMTTKIEETKKKPQSSAKKKGA